MIPFSFSNQADGIHHILGKIQRRGMARPHQCVPTDNSLPGLYQVPEDHLNIKMLSYKHRDSHCKDHLKFIIEISIPEKIVFILKLGPDFRYKAEKVILKISVHGMRNSNYLVMKTGFDIDGFVQDYSISSASAMESCTESSYVVMFGKIIYQIIMLFVVRWRTTKI